MVLSKAARSFNTPNSSFLEGEKKNFLMKLREMRNEGNR